MKPGLKFTTAALLAAMGTGSAFAQATVTGRDLVEGASDIMIGSGPTLSIDNSLNSTGGDATFAGSFFDLFGIDSNLNVQASGPFTGDRTLPRDIIDDSTVDSTDPFLPGIDSPNGDFNGILGYGANQRGEAFLVADINNGDNPSGTASAVWDFDTSGNANWNIHRLKVDAAASGDFEQTDDVDFGMQMDGGPLDTVLRFLGDLGNHETYTNTMDSGLTFEVTPDPFFEGSSWQAWVDAGLPADFATTDDDGDPITINAHPDDINDGTLDGFIDFPVPSDLSNQTRANQETNDNGTFNQTEEELLKDPMYVEVGAGADPSLNDGTVLNNEFQTITSNTFQATGNVLTVDVFFESNGGGEWFVFDDLIVQSAVLGDANGDGVLNNLDIAGFVAALTGSPDDDLQWVLDGNFDYQFNNLDINPFVDALTGGAPLTAEQIALFSAAGLDIPEPASLALIGVGGALVLVRRRRNA